MIQKITIKKAMELYLENLDMSRKISTKNAYANDFAQLLSFLKEILKKKTLHINDLQPIHLEHYKKHLIKKTNYSETTCYRKFASTRALIHFIADFTTLTPALLSYLKNDKFGICKKDKHIIKLKYITPETRKIILNRLEESYDKNAIRNLCIFKFLILLGLRRSTLLELKWSNFSFATNELQLHSKKSNSIITLSLPEDIISLLTTLKKLQLASGFISDFVFIGSSTESALSNTAYTALINKYTSGLLDTAGENITGHTFRHNAITHYIKHNVQMAQIADLTGITLETIQKYYNHCKSIDTNNLNVIMNSR